MENETQREQSKVMIHRALQYVSTLLIAVSAFFLVRIISKIDSMEVALNSVVKDVAVNTARIQSLDNKIEFAGSVASSNAARVAVVEGDIKALNVKVFDIPPY